MTPRGALDPIVLAFIRKLSSEPSERGALARLLFERAARLNGQAPDLIDQLEKLQRENKQLARRIRDLEVKRREVQGDALDLSTEIRMTGGIDYINFMTLIKYSCIF